MLTGDKIVALIYGFVQPVPERTLWRADNVIQITAWQGWKLFF